MIPYGRQSIDATDLKAVADVLQSDWLTTGPRVPAFERAGGGAIVNMSSTVALRSAPNSIAYTASKWAVRGMTKAAALELADRHVRVNSVHPGPIDTDMLTVRSREDNLRRVQQVPMKRLGTKEEIAKLVLFLLSEDSRYMTGSEVAMDGGAAL